MRLFASKKTAPHFRDVACAVIFQAGKILIARRRKNVHMGGLWEFPGGKRMAPESLGACLEREVLQELGIRVKPLQLLKKTDYLYPDRGVSLYFYECEFLGGSLYAFGCQEFRWVWPFELKKYAFPPANEAILN